MRAYLYLGIAIAAEVTGTTALKFSDGFTNAVPSAVVIAGYIGSFYFLSLTLQEFPIGLVYATWSAIGIVAAALLGVVLFDEPVDIAGLVGIALIIGGVICLNLFSDTYAPGH
ncbi:small multidrug resistance pump [Natrinema hispanicum]|uniref:Small multidrug resistance pump n=1 Tax=Natrinema hispanicum TaxID=392421 RepID=A0A482YFB1_9EURY|nr:multidrug efflux SMR transporter [Natrinema hispanicum]RZV11599.1 small multidrug resistance pump [Natrinema hispanicum]